jgi:hypothetical protein
MSIFILNWLDLFLLSSFLLSRQNKPTLLKNTNPGLKQGHASEALQETYRIASFLVLVVACDLGQAEF